MSKDTFDAVLASVPNGATAGRVTSKGTHYTPEIDFRTLNHWDAPPPTKPLPDVLKDRSLIGRRVGRLTVVGYLGKFNPKKKALWLVRCVCGDYESRHSAAIVHPSGGESCRVCSDLVFKRRRYEREGARPVEDFFVSVK